MLRANSLPFEVNGKAPIEFMGKKSNSSVKASFSAISTVRFLQPPFFFATFAFRQKAVAGIPVLGREY